MSIDNELRKIIREELRPILERLGGLQDVPQTLSVAAAARLAECDPKTILARIRGGELRGFRPRGSRAYRIEKGDFNRWLVGSASSPGQDPDALVAEVLEKELSGGGRKPRRRRPTVSG